MDEEEVEDVPMSLEDAIQEFAQERQERIAIRRARIAEKIAAAKRAEGLEEVASAASSVDLLMGAGDEKGAEEAEKLAEKGRPGSKKKGFHRKGKDRKEETKKPQVAVDLLDQQIEESRKQLEQMILDGETLITNVKVAAEYREKSRHNKQEESKKERLARLRQEADESQAMYDTLCQNWTMKAEHALPMDLFNQMKAQQEACDELLAKKDDLITFLRREIEENDFEYEGNLEMYQKDSMLMGDRIDDLVDDLRIAFTEELNLIEKYTCTNREVILQDNQNEWMDLLQHFEAMEKKNLEERKTDALAKFQTLNDIFIMTKQEARDLRHKMENDLRTLIQEREQIKYACHLNLEKMAYNLHILQCRSKENVELKNMMKRLLLQLHDKFDARASSLKRKMEMGRKHVEKLTKEIQRLETQVETFGQKTLHLAIANHRKYIDLWEVNEETIRDKVKDLLASDKFIYETQLGVEYAIPDLTPLDSRPKEVNKSMKKRQTSFGDKKAMFKKKTSKGKSIRESRQSRPSSFVSEEGDEESNSAEIEKSQQQNQNDTALECNDNSSLILIPTPSLEFIPGPDADPDVQRRLMKGIAKVICDQSGFIVEEELQKILEPLVEAEKNLVKLDAVLQAFGISNIQEMQSLSRFMLKYCQVMDGVMSKMGSDASAGVDGMNVSQDGIIGKAALMMLDYNESMMSLNNVPSITDSDSKECGQDIEQYCDCRIAKAKAKEENDKKKKGKQRRRTKNRKTTMKTQGFVQDPLSTMNVSQSENAGACAITCCSPSPGGSTEDILDLVESDQQLANALDVADSDDNKWAKTSQDDDNDVDDNDGRDCSLKSSKATVMSWLEGVDKEQVLEDLNTFNDELGQKLEKACEEQEAKKLKMMIEIEKGKIMRDNNEIGEKIEEYENEEEEEEEDEDEEEEEEEEENMEDEFEHLPTCPLGPRPRRLTPMEIREQEKLGLLHLPQPTASMMTGGASGEDERIDIALENESRVMSIHSYDSFSNASDEFLYIDPGDVVTALKNFIEDYNNRQKVVLPTQEEIIGNKIDNIKYPNYMEVAEYWEGVMKLLKPKGKDLWDTVQYCFDQYNKVLKERNECVIDIEKFYKENMELSHLLQKYIQSDRRCLNRFTPRGALDPSGMGFC